MSYLVEPMQLDFLNNKDRENVFRLNDDSDETFNFKYVSTSQFRHIIKDVKRQRSRKKEESLWASLEHRHESRYRPDDRVNPGGPNIELLLEGDAEEVDQELRRLEEDALPERTSRDKCRTVRVTRSGKTRKAEASSSIGERKAGSSVGQSLTDEETDSPSTLERSPLSKLEYGSTRTRKSHSERTLRANGESDDEFGCFEKRSVYNNRRRAQIRENEDAAFYEVRLHPLVAHKILAIQKKVSNLLDEIDFRLRNIPLPDGDRDLRRRQQCAMEFAIRFSRNYLYNLGRQIEEIRRHVRALTPRSSLRQSRRCFSLHVQAIEQKLTSAHQLLLQALTAYCKHIPSSVLKGQPGKVKEILQVLLDLRDICTKINLTADYYERGDVEPPPLGKDTQNRCAAILSRLRLSSDNESPIFNRTVQSTPVERFRDKSNDKNDKRPPARLSMYRANARLPAKNLHTRKHVRSCTRERRASHNVHTTPERHHPTTPEQPSPGTPRVAKDVPKRSRPKIRLPLKEDEIPTMISILPTDSDADSSIALSGKCQSSISIHKGSSTRTQSEKTPSSKTRSSNALASEHANENDIELANANLPSSDPMTAKELTSLVPVIADLMSLVRNQQQNEVEIRPATSDSMQVLTDILRTYRSLRHTENPTGANERAGSAIKSDGNSRTPAKRRPGVGNESKNVQLICLPSEEEKIRPTKCATVDSPETQRPTTRERTNRTLRASETSLEMLLKYRDDYRDWSETNPMYTSKSQNKPWDIVAWIADKLVDEMVVDVSKEFEIHDVIQKLFELEFKEF